MPKYPNWILFSIFLFSGCVKVQDNVGVKENNIPNCIKLESKPHLGATSTTSFSGDTAICTFGTNFSLTASTTASGSDELDFYMIGPYNDTTIFTHYPNSNCDFGIYYPLTYSGEGKYTVYAAFRNQKTSSNTPCSMDNSYSFYVKVPINLRLPNPNTMLLSGNQLKDLENVSIDEVPNNGTIHITGDIKQGGIIEFTGTASGCQQPRAKQYLPYSSSAIASYLNGNFIVWKFKDYLYVSPPDSLNKKHYTYYSGATSSNPNNEIRFHIYQ